MKRMKDVQRITVFMGLVVTCLVGFTLTVSAEEILLVGTDDAEPIFEAVADAFIQLNPGVTITLPEAIGSTGAIKAVGRDKAVLGRVVRDIREHEKHYGLTYVSFAKSLLVFFVNKNVGVQKLSAQQVLDMYSGKVRNWKDVGGNDVKVRVLTFEEGDSNIEVLEESFPGFEDISITSRSKTVSELDECIEIVENTRGAIGYGGYAEAHAAHVDILQVDRKGATDPDYPYAVTLGFVFKETHYTGNIKKFVEFVTSEAAHEVVEEAGAIPLKQ